MAGAIDKGAHRHGEGVRQGVLLVILDPFERLAPERVLERRTFHRFAACLEKGWWAVDLAKGGEPLLAVVPARK